MSDRMEDMRQVDIKQLEIAMQATLNASLQVIGKEIFTKLDLDSEKKQRSIDKIYEKIDEKYKRQEKCLNDFVDKVDERLDEMDSEISAIKIECAIRRAPFERVVAHVETPHEDNDSWAYRKIGERFVQIVYGVVIAYLCWRITR